jgi:hypothetical protein
MISTGRLLDISVNLELACGEEPNHRLSITDNPFQGKESGPMTPEENKLFIQRFVEETIDRKNLDAIHGLLFVYGYPCEMEGDGAGQRISQR